jgi:hypothetical protein
MLELFEIRLGLGELEGGSPILCVNELLYLTSPRSPLAATSFSPEVTGSHTPSQERIS